MEAILEFLLSLFWDTIKTLALQWLIDYFKEWWSSRKSMALNY
jgi:hypothetical protein